MVCVSLLSLRVVYSVSKYDVMCFYFYWRTREKILPVLLFFFLVDLSHSFGLLNFKGKKSIRDNSFYSLEY